MRLAKLRGMSAAELAHRLRYAIATRRERRRHRGGRLALADGVRGTLCRELRASHDWMGLLAERRRQAAPFLAGAEHPETTRRVFADRFAAESAVATRAAVAVRRHEISFFGETFRFGTSIPWHEDPCTGVEWPRVYHRDVPTGRGDVGFGDVKHVWELNRHQFLVDLAKHAFLSQSREDADTVTALRQDWSAAVPYATGVPWACALEPAFRVWSWMWVYDLLTQAGFLSDADHCDWLSGFVEHGRFLFRHLERYSSPYNHLVGEASALFALGVLFPEFDEAARWESRGRTVLEETLTVQFHPDGGSVEQSTFYHHATLGFYLLAALMGRRRGVELSEDVTRGIERGLEFSLALTMPDGRVPAIGGADDGKPIRFEHVRFFDFRPYLAIGAVLFERSDFKQVATRFWEDAWWLLGAAGLESFEQLGATIPPRSMALRDSGYFVTRSGWGPDADYLCVDCGPQAGGLRRDAVPSAAHGHADCLSLVVALAGEAVLVDPGFFCYNGDPEWEVHFRRTRAHSTVTVDHRDQARHLEKMHWSHTYQPALEAWETGSGWVMVRGSHDGYARCDDGVLHRRTVRQCDDGYVVIHDELTGSGEHDVLVNFQCAPGAVTVAGDGKRASLHSRFELAWVGNHPLECETASGGEGPGDGWVATSLGVRRPAPRIGLRCRMRGGVAAVLSIVTDTQRVKVSDTGGARPDELEIRVEGSGWVDVIRAAGAELSVSRHPRGSGPGAMSMASHAGDDGTRAS